MGYRFDSCRGHHFLWGLFPPSLFPTYLLRCGFGELGYDQRTVKKWLQLGLLGLSCGLLGVACGGPTEEVAVPDSVGIPESQYELFANLVHSTANAEAELEAAWKTENRVKIARAQAVLDERHRQMQTLFVSQYGAATVERWKATVRGADNTAEKRREAALHGEELLRRLKALGVKGALDADGFITELNCRNVKLPEDMIKRLGNCVQLKRLNLQGTGVTDENLAMLAPLETLTALNLSDNTLEGTTLSQLESLTKLEELDLSNTQIGDAAVGQFEILGESAKALRSMNLQNTKITLTGYDRITKAFKQTVIRQP